MDAATINTAIKDVLGIKGKAAVNVDSIIRKGLPMETVKRFKKTFNMDEETLARSIGVSRKTLQRKGKGTGHHSLNVGESNRLFRALRILSIATETFGGARDVALDWMREPQFGLGGMTPLAMIETDIGTERVESLLMQLQHGGAV